MSLPHEVLATDKVLFAKRALCGGVTTALFAAFCMVAVPTSSGATTPFTGPSVQQEQTITPSEFIGNANFFPLTSVPAANPRSKSLAVSPKTGIVNGARALPSKVAPALTPASTTFVVNTTHDTSLAVGNSTSCADVDGNCSLRAAVEAADNLGNQKTPQAASITLPAGTYTLTSAQGGEIYVENSAGITVNGAGAGTTTIASDGSDRVIGMGGEELGTPLALNGVTVTGGVTNEGSDILPPDTAFTLPKPKDLDDGNGCGGGIMEEDANDLLELSGVVVSANAATNAGGGVCADGTLYAANTTITGNEVTDPLLNNDGDQTGGGLVTGWDDFGAAVLNDVTITKNTVDTGSQVGTDEHWFGAGGGTSFLYGSVASVTNSVISDNTVTSSSASCKSFEGKTVGFCGFEGGGGVVTLSANVSITSTSIANNTVTQSAPCADNCEFGALGGGVLDISGLSLSGDTVTGNVATTGSVGNDTENAAVGGGIASYAPLTIDSSTVSNNQIIGAANIPRNCGICTQSGGGGIFQAATGFVLSNSTLSANTAVDGGGAGFAGLGYGTNQEVSPITGNNQNTFVLSNDQITSNKATSSRPYDQNPDPYLYGTGGGIDLLDGGSLQMSGTAIDGNSADGLGGGLYADDVTQALITKSTIANNRAQAGGGIFNGDEGELNASNVTVADNTALATAATCGGNCWLPPGGGGIYNYSDSGLNLSYSTVAGNVAPAGNAGIFFEDGNSPSSLVGTIVAGNVTAPGGAESDCSADSGQPLVSGGWNLSGDGSCWLTQPTDLVSVNPELGPLANNGGPAPTLLPAKSSPVVDAGGGAACPATDERGIARPQGKACDIGAVELFVPPAGYWTVGSDGGVFAFGGAGFFGSAGGPGLNAPAVGIAPDAGWRRLLDR